MVGFLNVACFTATSSGTGDFVVFSAVTGYQTPAAAGAINGTVYGYRAESADLSQWEVGTGAYTTGTNTLARTNVLSSSTGSKVSFSASPRVAITALAANLAVLPAASTDKAAVRYSGTGGATLQDSPLLIADVTGALSRSGNGGIPVQATNTNDSAASGYVGEYISATGAAVALTSGTASNVCSISLTAGDWDVTGSVIHNFAPTTNYTIRDFSISTTSGATNTSVGSYMLERLGTGQVPGATIGGETVGPVRFSITTPTTVYLTGRAFFTVSTVVADGVLRARRVR